MLHRFRVRASHWALVWAVAFAVVGMHHLGTQEFATHATTASAAATVVDCCDHASEEHTPTPTGPHDELHLCLAILCAALGLTLAVLALRGRTVTAHLNSLSIRAARPRSPPPRPGGAPARLAELCVLRL